MKSYSVWQQELKNNYNKLNSDIEVDILIVGGGITGISTAYHLINSNLKVCVIEKNVIGSGVTSKTTGKLTYLQDLMYTKIQNKYNFDVAKMYYESQKDAIKLVSSIIKKHNIDCDYTKQKSFLFAFKKEEIEKVNKEELLLLKMGAKVSRVKQIPINIHSYNGIYVTDTYYFHPIKYLNQLAKICNEAGILIYENTNVFDFKMHNDYYECFTDKYKIKCKKIVFACHYPFFTIPYLFPIKGHLQRSYISASNVLEPKDLSGINTINDCRSFRYHKNYLIYLNKSHNLAFKYNVLDNYKPLLTDLSKLNIKPDYIWTNEDIITNDYLPYIGHIKNNLYIATGFNTWGMTNGSIAGYIISDLIKNKENKYSSLFNPNRSNNIFSIFYDAFSSAKPIIENKIIKNKSFYSNNVIFTKKNGQNIAIYTDELGNKHTVYNTCPHLKCSLIFNEVEHTWDCPCHASRFDIDGKCIKGPSNYDISYKDK